MTGIFAALEATWPPATVRRVGPWRVRKGLGGGGRVSSATATAPVGTGDLPPLVDAARSMGQRPLVQVRPGEDALDALLDAAGWPLGDPTCLRSAPVETVARLPLPPLSAFTIWEPLAIMDEIWDSGGIGPARRAVMARTRSPRTGVLGRADNTPCGSAFAAVSDGHVFVHAAHVIPAYRRAGVGRAMMVAAARWGQDAGASWLSVAVTHANTTANSLYSSLNMPIVGEYHYRNGPDDLAR